ncbi:hypothetical protein H7B90_05670 [Cohnella xylanilytica]|uniref:Uncharacterized protein n=1 Tax=Cohnella xylanilytica TaxID=557555 RepID=A0A841TV18_9BACL|nr:hypothetical protein [Cohnella xylanilytica]MBB6690888.1 hypothetical protein [Cohnella xylanilytica]
MRQLLFDNNMIMFVYNIIIFIMNISILKMERRLACRLLDGGIHGRFWRLRPPWGTLELAVTAILAVAAAELAASPSATAILGVTAAELTVTLSVTAILAVAAVELAASPSVTAILVVTKNSVTGPSQKSILWMQLLAAHLRGGGSFDISLKLQQKFLLVVCKLDGDWVLQRMFR